MGVDPELDQFTYRLLDWPHRHLDQRSAYQLYRLLGVAINHRGHERLLAWKILVERADADARRVGNPIGARAIVSILHKNASSRFKKRIHRQARALLRC